MSWGAIAGAAIGLVGGAIGKRQQNKGIDRATAASEQAAREANALQREIWQTGRQDNAGFLGNANTAQSMFMQMMGLQPYGMNTGGGAQPQPQPQTGGAPGGGGYGGGGSPGYNGFMQGTPLTQDTQRGLIALGNQGQVKQMPGVNTGGPGQMQGVGPMGTGGPGQLGGFGDVRTGGPAQVGGGLSAILQRGRMRDGTGAAEYARNNGGMAVNTGGPGQVGGGAPQANPNFQQTAFDMWRSTPGYQFNLDEGRNQLESSAAARGSLYSGAALKALTQYGQNYADRTYGDYMNRLASVAGMGQTANSQNAQLGMNYGNQTGNNLINAGNTRASGLLQKGQNSADFAAGVGGMLNRGFQNYAQFGQWGNPYGP